MNIPQLVFKRRETTYVYEARCNGVVVATLDIVPVTPPPPWGKLYPYQRVGGIQTVRLRAVWVKKRDLYDFANNGDGNFKPQVDSWFKTKEDVFEYVQADWAAWLGRLGLVGSQAWA